MRIRAIAGVLAVAAVLTLSACSTSGTASESPAPAASPASESMASSEPMESSEPMAEARTGQFEGLNEKSVSGTVEVTDSEIVFSGFSSDEGPDLHVYLTNGTDEAAVAAGVRIDVIDFGAASQTFAVSGVDVSQYSDVVIHCDKASAVFGAASLS